MKVPDVKGAQSALNDRILGKPGIEGTAIGQTDGKPCLKVYVSDREAASRVPSTFQGFPVLVETSGGFRRR